MEVPYIVCKKFDATNPDSFADFGAALNLLSRVWQEVWSYDQARSDNSYVEQFSGLKKWLDAMYFLSNLLDL